MREREGVPRWQTVFIHALISSVRTRPEPAVFLILDSLDKVLAHFFRRGLWIAVLARHHFPQLLLVPRIHSILFLDILLVVVARILVEIPLFGLSLHIRIVTELALPPLFAVTLLEKYTEHRLRVDTEWDLLRLHGLEKLGGFFFGLFGCELIFLTLGLFCFPPFGLRILIGNRLGL